MVKEPPHANLYAGRGRDIEVDELVGYINN